MRIDPSALFRVCLLTFAMFSARAPDAAWAQLPSGVAPTAEAPAVDPLTPAEIQARQEALKAELAEVGRELAAQPEASAPRDALSDVRTRLRGIETHLRQQRELAKDLPTPKADTAGDGAPPADEAEQPSLFALNELHEKQLRAESRLVTRGADLAASREALTSAKERLEKKKRTRRETREALEAVADPAARADLAHALRLSEIDVREASERVNLRTLERRAAKRKLESAQAKVPELAARIESMHAALESGAGDSSDGYAALTRREGDLQRAKETLERALSTAELRLEAAQRRFAKLPEAPPELLQEVELLTLRRDALRQEIAIVEARIERAVAQRADWRRWEQVLRDSATREDLRAWTNAAEEKIAAIEQEELQRQGRSADLSQQLEEVNTRLAAAPQSAKLRGLLEERRAVLAHLLEIQATEDRDLAADRRLTQRLLGELHARTGHVDFVEYARRGAGAVRDTWGYEITSVEEDPITIGSLITALLLVVVGFLISRNISAAVGRLASDRFRLDRGAAAALQTLAFYVFLVSFTLLALRAVSFPLTAFTVLGGALAIGVGFGSQNVMNNFISGLILMLERPIRAQDLIEVDGNHGTVEKIGARSTQIRSTDGRHFIVPNSFFLENNVVNWTLSDDLIRAVVSVGVVYGSPTRLVERLMREIMKADPKILDRPEPMVIFQEFGDNALIFDAYFWVRARNPTQVRVVQSEVRFQIDEAFRQHQLVIAFPQRDVHIDSAAPLQVRLVEPADRGPGKAPGEGQAG